MLHRFNFVNFSERPFRDHGKAPRREGRGREIFAFHFPALLVNYPRLPFRPWDRLSENIPLKPDGKRSQPVLGARVGVPPRKVKRQDRIPSRNVDRITQRE